MSGSATLSEQRPSSRRTGAAFAFQKLVHHALGVVAQAAARGDLAGGYTPLVIVGPPGAGKSAVVSSMFVEYSLTHHRVVQPSRSRPAAAVHPQPSSVPAMWDGRTLGRDVAAALSHDTLHRLRDRLTAPRLVIIDGVEQITAWDVQRVLAQLIDLATDGGTNFIVTSRMHPMACSSLEPSLASRLAGGLVVPMPPSVVPRGTDGAGGATAPSLRKVIGATARFHGLSPADLTGPSRCRQAARARGIAMYLARTLTAKSLQAIGRAFGGRDHTTVLHGIRVTEERRSRDPAVAGEIERLVAGLVRPPTRVVGQPAQSPPDHGLDWADEP